jgi:predicted TIM-barrel fold metal-dependent hydrolase
MKIIDPHLHLFNLKQGDYQWLKADNPPFWSDKSVIEKNFSEKNLQLAFPLELAGFVHIEAGFDNQQPWREIAWLESSCSLPFKSIAGINLLLSLQKFQQALNKLSQFNSVVGVREILDENALSYLRNQQVQDNLAQLAEHELIFECQMPLENNKAVAQLMKIISKLPSLKIVINHAGWPPENTLSQAWKNWQQSIKALSYFPSVTIKCSGFEMGNRQYTTSWQQQIIRQCITDFGLSRTMLASNFPLCLFKASYQKNWQTLQANSQLSKDKLKKLYYENAFRIYKF